MRKIIGLSVLLFGCATMSSSQKAFELAWASCMQAKGLNAASGAWQTVLNDLNAGTSVDGVLEQLKGLGIQSGVDSVSCAVSVWMHPANPAELNPYGVAAAKEWLLEHSTVTQD